MTARGFVRWLHVANPDGRVSVPVPEAFPEAGTNFPSFHVVIDFSTYLAEGEMMNRVVEK
jgi:hypothetical protein